MSPPEPSYPTIGPECTNMDEAHERVSLNQREMKAEGLRADSLQKLTSSLKDSFLLSSPSSEGFGSCSEGSLTDSRRPWQVQASRLYHVPEPEERLLFGKARRIPQTWPELYCRQDGGGTVYRKASNAPAHRCTSCESTGADALSVSSQCLGGISNPPS